MITRIDQARLYGIVDLGYVDEGDVESVASALLGGGVGVLQLRAKGHDLEKVESWAELIQPLCAAAGVPFIVNDYPAIAVAVGADGVHIGQDDGSLADVKKVVGAEMLVGRSTHSLEQAKQAYEDGFDYIGLGPLFATPTKLGRPGIGVDDVKAVEQNVGARIPVFCIGGIKRENLRDVLLAGARRVVIVSDLLSAVDVRMACAEVVEAIDEF